ncbi:hypothetical protein Tco_0673593 [Tanacetum coccineum]
MVLLHHHPPTFTDYVRPHTMIGKQETGEDLQGNKVDATHFTVWHVLDPNVYVQPGDLTLSMLVCLCATEDTDMSLTAYAVDHAGVRHYDVVHQEATQFLTGINLLVGVYEAKDIVISSTRSEYNCLSGMLLTNPLDAFTIMIMAF